MLRKTKTQKDSYELLAEDDKVVARCKGSGTHQGSFRGIPATGKKMTYPVIFIWRFVADKMAEHWAVSDVYGMLQQLEVIQINHSRNVHESRIIRLVINYECKKIMHDVQFRQSHLL
jgi:SnoaL-like polyketide cyclase